MRRFSVLFGVLLVFAGSCANLMEGNVFENFDGPEDAGTVLRKYSLPDGTIDPARMDAFIRDLENSASSPRFFRGLSASDREKLDKALRSVYGEDSGASVASRQKAAVLAGQTNMRGNDAGRTANNVIDVLVNDGVDSFDNSRELLNQVIPADVRGNPTKVAEILDNLAAAGDAYEALGSTLDGSNPAPAGTNMGAVAQNALVAITVRNIVGANGDSAALAAAVADPDAQIEDPDFGDDGVFGPDGSPLRNLFNTAGLGGVLDD